MHVRYTTPEEWVFDQCCYRYNDAMIAVRRVTGAGMEHQFELAVTRVYEEGDENLFEDEDESK